MFLFGWSIANQNWLLWQSIRNCMRTYRRISFRIYKWDIKYWGPDYVVFKNRSRSSVKRTSKRISSGAITSVKMIRCQNLRCWTFFLCNVRSCIHYDRFDFIRIEFACSAIDGNLRVRLPPIFHCYFLLCTFESFRFVHCGITGSRSLFERVVGTKVIFNGRH